MDNHAAVRSTGELDPDFDHDYKLKLWRLQGLKLKHEEEGLKLEYERKAASWKRGQKRHIQDTADYFEQEAAAVKRTRRNAQEPVVGTRKQVNVIDLSETSPSAEFEALVDGKTSEDQQTIPAGKCTLRTRDQSRAAGSGPDDEEPEVDYSAGRERKGRPRDRRRRGQQFKYVSINRTFPTVCIMPNGNLAELRCARCLGNTTDTRFFKFLKPGSSLYQHYRHHNTEVWENVRVEEVMEMSVHHWLDAREADAVLNEQEHGYIVPAIPAKKVVTTGPAATAGGSVGCQMGSKDIPTSATRDLDEDDEEEIEPFQFPPKISRPLPGLEHYS